MPNHIQNVLRICAYEHKGARKELVDEILSAIRSDESALDFNSLIQMPKLLRNTGSGYNTIDGKEHRAWYVEEHASKDNGWKEKTRAFTDEEKAALADIGYQNWYDWACANWGTKWNAYSVIAGKTSCGDGIVTFETAWAPPMPVLDALAAKFPSADFRLLWSDEGDNRQHRVYWENGKRQEDEE